MKLLRTADERFADLPDFDYPPHYVEVDGLRLHAVDEGPRAADPVLLLHGEPTWSFLYRHMIPPLVAAGHRVVAPDLPGFGRSDKPAAADDYTYARLVAWMASWLEAVDLQRITLVCQDWGSLVGLRLAAEHPARFARIVLTNGGLPTGDQTMPPAFTQWQTFAGEAARLPIGRIVQGGTTTTLSSAVLDGYRAPFPDEPYKAGARLAAARADATGRSGGRGQPTRVGRLRALGEAVSDGVQRRGPYHGRRRSLLAAARARRRRATARDNPRRRSLCQEDNGAELAAIKDAFVRRAA